MKTVSVIIPTRNEFKNLLWTLQGAQADLEGIDYELIVVLNRCHPDDKEKLEKYYAAQKGWLKVIEYNDRGSCWQSRNAGAEIAQGEYLLFLDSHVLPATKSFTNLIEFHEGWKGVAHCAVNYWLHGDKRTLYGYTWQPNKFWGSWTSKKPEPPDYRVLHSGTSSTLIDRDVYEEIRGFHPALGIYGGGESYFDLKVQMFGYEVRLPPWCRLWHLTEPRGYNWNNDDMHRNFMIAAYALGGHDALQLVFENYHKGCKGVKRYEERNVELKSEAIELAEEDRQWISENAQYTLEEVINGYFAE